ncbi:hypothetical protein N0V93_002856 [Gnomoniopsis smithogilvyi]|uniref:Uncharacterized protein n=1 Tax=Gnomoniopsis smithogilvyi TaxID=1191159 RepID=A0A9W9CZC0_9PEZI|nr:hypothetical protein N0V93_002856 [Gnomoniopsis smithogilvyi]
MSSTEAGGRQSPAPEDQSNAQVGQPAGGQGTDSSDNKQSSNKDDLSALSSNPKGPLDDAVKDKFTKTEETPINK